MAQAQYDEFVRLRKTGTDALTARKQAYGETPVASVTPVTPAVPTTPVPVSTPQVPTSSEVIQGVKDLGGDVQNRQNTRNVMTGKGGTVTPSGAILNADGSVTPAPIETSSAPVTPAPTPTTPVETPAPIDKNAEIKAKNEAQMALNKQKSELAIADRKRQAEEVKLASIPTDQKGVLNALISGASVPTQNTQAYRNAKVQYDTYKKFNSMTPTQLLDNLKMNEIGTDMDQLLASNPNYVQAKQKLNEIQKVTNLNKTMSNIVAGANGTEIKAVTPEQNEIDISTKLMQKFGLDDANAEAFSQFIATDEEMADNKAKLLANRNQLSNVNRQINETTTLLNQGIKDIKAQYPDMSASGIITLMGSRLSEFNDTITNLNSTKSLLDADIKMEMDLAKSAFDAKSADIQAQNQIRSAMAIGDYNASIDLQKSQAEFEQKIAQQAQAMNDPTMAIKSVMDEYKKLGIPFTSTVQSRLAEFKASGKPLAQFLTEMGQNIQASPAYQKYQSLQQGQMSDVQKMQATQAFQTQSDIRNFSQQKELAVLNKDLGRQDFLWQIENDPEKKMKALELEQKLQSNKSLFDVLGKNVGTYEGNRGYDLAGNLGDPLPAGGNWTVKSIDTAGEQVGSIFIGGKGKKPYGNTVVMQDENGNEIRYSHLQNIGVKPGDVLGFGDIVGTRGNTGNVKGANGEILTAEQLKAGRGAHLDVEIKSGGKLLSNADQVNFLKGLKSGGDQPLTDKQFTQYNQTKTGFKSEPIVKSFEEALIAGGDIIQSLGSENGPGDVGAVFNFMKSLDPTSTVREGEFALAAKSAGVWESFKNIPANKLEGTILTDKQRKDLGKLAMKYIESKGKLYDTKYNDMVKVLENQGIPKSYYPTKMTNYVNQYKGTQETVPTSDDPFGIR